MIDELVVQGGKIETVEIANGPFRAELLTLGASLRRLDAPAIDGTPGNVVLGYQDLEYYRGQPRFYGATAGRYANRIANASFSLDGKTFTLPKNNGPHNLHSGPLGYDQRFWTLEGADASSARFSLLSHDGENGFPGTLHVDLEYRLEEDGLAISMTATTDKPTVVNLTNHAYFNLAGEASGHSVLGQWLQIPATRFTPTEGQIPTGVLQDVAGTAFDFLTAKPIGADIEEPDPQIRAASGFDHNYVVDTPSGRIRRVATAWDPGTGRVLEVHSSEPGVQFYSGNFLARGMPGTSGGTYGNRAGFCLEPQKFPDSPNKPDFPSARLDPGQKYVHEMAFRFRVAGTFAEAFPKA